MSSSVREAYEQAWLEREQRRRKPIVYGPQGRCDARKSLPERRCVLPYGHTGDHKFEGRGL